MPTKRDLVEAHAFSRRRLVTAFVSGAPGGREVEPARPGRTIVGGLALALLVVAGGAVAGLLFGRDEADWKQPGLVISKHYGQPYVVTVPDDGGLEVRPVVNITSARLILGSDATPTFVSDEAIEAEHPGELIGILNAPTTVPSPDDLLQTGWTACTGPGQGVAVRLGSQPGVTLAPEIGFLVESHGIRYVVAQAAPTTDETPSGFLYRLPDDAGRQDNLLRDLGLGVGADAVPVTSDWLSLWPVGGALEWSSFGIEGAGEPVSYSGGGSGIPAGARVGDIVTTSSESVVLAPDGPQRLTPFALAVLRNSLIDGRPARELSSTTIEVAHEPLGTAAAWPATTLAVAHGEHCAELVAAPGAAPIVALGVVPVPAASSASVPAGRRAVSVSTGGGAVVLSAGWEATGEGSPYLIDGDGTGHPLQGDDAVEHLGFGGVDAPVVPDSWVELFDPGVVLSVADALCPPMRTNEEPCG